MTHVYFEFVFAEILTSILGVIIFFFKSSSGFSSSLAGAAFFAFWIVSLIKKTIENAKKETANKVEEKPDVDLKKKIITPKIEVKISEKTNSK